MLAFPLLHTLSYTYYPSSPNHSIFLRAMAPQFLSRETQILSLLDDDLPSFFLIFDQRSAKGLLSVQFHIQYPPVWFLFQVMILSSFLKNVSSRPGSQT